MFYHMQMGILGVDHFLIKNKIKDEILNVFLCPFINKEVTFVEDELLNMSSYGSIKIFETEKVIDSDWPINKSEFMKEFEQEHKIECNSDKLYFNIKYEDEVIKKLVSISKDLTFPFYQEAIILLETGKYQEIRNNIAESIKEKYCFFICPLENKEIEENYEIIIKPLVKQYHFNIQKSNEISRTGTINDTIIEAIKKSRFIIADLSLERPNCYYEVGFAHALGKPVIITAKKDTVRHFDVSTYKWIYWNNYKDLKINLETELEGILKYLKIIV